VRGGAVRVRARGRRTRANSNGQHVTKKKHKSFCRVAFADTPLDTTHRYDPLIASGSPSDSRLAISAASIASPAPIGTPREKSTGGRKHVAASAEPEMSPPTARTGRSAVAT